MGLKDFSVLFCMLNYKLECGSDITHSCASTKYNVHARVSKTNNILSLIFMELNKLDSSTPRDNFEIVIRPI
jgi:hypothetical protein